MSVAFPHPISRSNSTATKLSLLGFQTFIFYIMLSCNVLNFNSLRSTSATVPHSKAEVLNGLAVESHIVKNMQSANCVHHADDAGTATLKG
jgi:hypothetical protein